VVASSTVQGFSTQSLADLTIEEVERRYQIVQRMSAF